MTVAKKPRRREEGQEVTAHEDRHRQRQQRDGRRRSSSRTRSSAAASTPTLIWESVTQENAAERRGTHQTKNRSAVSGSGKKPWRQKGTGRARVGEIRNPLWRKGGTVFGPMPRSYEYSLPRKVKLGALRAALSAKLADGTLLVVDSLKASDGDEEDQGDRRDVQEARRHGQDAGHRRQARRGVHADGAQHRRRPARAEQPRHGARRHGHGSRDRDARGAREAAGERSAS